MVLGEADSLLAATEDLVIECSAWRAAHGAAHAAPGNRTAAWRSCCTAGRAVHARSTCVSGADRLWREGFRIVRINMRDHGDSQHLNRDIFHSCRLDEMVDAVRWVRDRFPGEPLYLGGYSLGGNFALRIAAAEGPALGLARVVAICPVLDPEETMEALDSGSVIYRQYFISKWRRSLERKARAFPDDYDFGSLNRFRSLRDMTEFFVTRYTDFPDLVSYLRGYAITGERLARLSVPASILLADDDPGDSRRRRPPAWRVPPASPSTAPGGAAIAASCSTTACGPGPTTTWSGNSRSRSALRRDRGSLPARDSRTRFSPEGTPVAPEGAPTPDSRSRAGRLPRRSHSRSARAA